MVIQVQQMLAMNGIIYSTNTVPLLKPSLQQSCPETQNRAVIWENRALKSVVGVPDPSGFEARSNALSFASSKFSACKKANIIKNSKTETETMA